MLHRTVGFSIFAALLLLAGCTTTAPQPTQRAPAAPAPASKAFERTLELQGISFRVSCPNDSSLNKLTVAPSGLEADNSPITREIDGIVTAAEIADINVDNSPEIYIYVQSAGSGSYGSLVAYSANRRKSLSEISLPAVADDPKLRAGYQGHDEFAVVENTFVQRFPIYSAGDANASPTGKTRQLQYKLTPGEAGWKLKLDRAVEF